MEAACDSGHIAQILPLYDHVATQEARGDMLRSLHELEQSSRRLMRARLRPGEFAEIQALADACGAACDILSSLPGGD